jgi:hypothetical protein
MIMSTGTDRVTTIFGIVVVAVLAVLATLVFRRGSPRHGSLVIASFFLLAAMASAYVYNLVPGLRVAPEEHDRAVCDRGEDLRNEGDSYYRWDITTHAWICHDNWLVVPGIPGV